MLVLTGTLSKSRLSSQYSTLNVEAPLQELLQETRLSPPNFMYVAWLCRLLL